MSLDVNVRRLHRACVDAIAQREVAVATITHRVDTVAQTVLLPLVAQILLHYADPFLVSTQDISRDIEALRCTSYISDVPSLGSSTSLLLYRLLPYEIAPAEPGQQQSARRPRPRVYRLSHSADGENELAWSSSNSSCHGDGTAKKRSRSTQQPNSVERLVDHHRGGRAAQGVCRVRDIDRLVLSYLAPREVRCAEGVCWSWYRIVSNSAEHREQLKKVRHVSFILQRFFHAEWGQLHVRIMSWI
eukprot:PhM_4_TR2789/c0_g1_i1/m.78382